MRINCNIDGQTFSFVLNADKPLNKVLQESVPSFSVRNKCLGASCGNCIVLLNGSCVLSCLVPAYKLNGANIETFESFRKTKDFHDIEKAFADTGDYPCSQCYASKVLLIESILQRRAKRLDASRAYIAQEININNCRCIEANQLEKIINLAYDYRSKRNGRKS